MQATEGIKLPSSAVRKVCIARTRLSGASALAAILVCLNGCNTTTMPSRNAGPRSTTSSSVLTPAPSAPSARTQPCLEATSFYHFGRSQRGCDAGSTRRKARGQWTEEWRTARDEPRAHGLQRLRLPYQVCAQPGQVSSSGFCWPAYGTVSRGFKIGHKGLDVLAPTGTPVYAAKAGTVIYAGTKLSGFGKVVIIDHGNKVATIYGHNSSMLVQEGQCVRQGQQIACVGQTGRATAPHCHFEIRNDGTPMDPRPLLP